MLPLISVLLPVYNGQKYLQECLESIKNQNYKIWELIIVNDGSTDCTDEIIKSFIVTIPNEVKYLTFEHKGLPFCLNKGVGVASGKYIARMDADDIMLENRLKLQLDYLENNKDIGVLGGHVLEIDENGVVCSIIKHPQNDFEIKQSFRLSSALIHPTVMIRKELLQANLYKELYPNPEDMELWIRLAKITNFSNLDAIILKKRFHSKQITTNSRIFKVRLNKDILLRNLENHNYNILVPFLKMVAFCILPKKIHFLWHKFRFNHRKAVFSSEQKKL
jgi:glycosyltransferase involved in cell wall biosynthesis